ncbi:MAG: PQQ-binding-like beta-propeller repeat protein, partial [Planctomycetes bacterium]|nr:PQQ-binding-like beta-propeller repeat protein [Planctomycetota bacterium]
KALIAALDKREGITLWTTPPLEGDRTSHCSPILFRYAGRRQITNCSSAHGFGVDADTGELLWTVPLKNRFGTNIATPIYGSGSVYFVTPYTDFGRLYRLSADAGGVRTPRQVRRLNRGELDRGLNRLTDEADDRYGFKDPNRTSP